MQKDYSLTHLEILEAEAIYVLREVAAQFERTGLLFSGGKDSIVVAHLARKAFHPSKLPFPLVHIDTGHNFAETLKFRDDLAEKTGAQVIVASVQKTIDEGKVIEEKGHSDHSTNYNLVGHFTGEKDTEVDFSVSVCKNKTDSAIICKSKEEIDKKLQGGFFVINYVDTIFDHNNYKEPYKYVRKNFYTSMSNKFIKSMTFWLRNVEYTTDSGIFFADEETKKFVNTEDIKEYYDMREADKFIGAVFRLSYTQETIKRRYLKIPVVIAEVGGFIKGINIILSLLFYFYTKMDFYTYLINKIYFLDSDDKINQKQNILQSQIKKLKTIKNSEHNKINASSQHNMQNLNQIEHLKLNLKRNNDQSQRPNSRVIQNEGNLKNQDDYDYSAEYITLTKRFRSNKETKKDFGIFDKLCIIIKMCFPFRKTELEGQKATYYSLDQIMNKFDCIRYLKNFEEIRIIKNIFMEEENIKIIDNLVNYKKKPENEIENQSNMENIDLKESLKNILSSNKSQNIKLKDMIKNYGLI